MRTLGILGTLLLAAVPAWPQAPAPQAPTSPQTTPATGRKLTLSLALELAQKQNLDLAAARLRRAISEAGIRIAKEYPNPTVTFEILRDTPHESLFFDQPLDISGKRHHRIDVAHQEVTLTDLEIAALARQVRRETREAFFLVLETRGTTALFAQSLELAKRIKEIAQTRFDAGDVPQLEVFQADLEVARAQVELTVAQQEEKVATSQLNVLLNEPSETVWDVSAALEELPPAQTLGELVARAQQYNSDVVHLAQEYKVEESRHALLKAERIPNLSVEFGSDFNAPRDFRAGPRGGLNMELPLFSRQQGELAESTAILREIESETLATRRSVAGKVEAAYLEWSTRQTQANLYKQTLLPTVEKLEQMAEESYRAGKSNLLSVIDAQRNVQQVRREYLDSILALQSAFAALEETVGAALD